MIQRKKKGFSLVEMLVVIAIIAVLVSIVTPMIAKSTVKAAAATNASNLRAAKGAFTTMKLMYPENYESWLGGFTAITGVTAVNEEFVVSADANKTARNFNSGLLLMAAGEQLTVPAPNAVKMKLDTITVAEGTAMTVQLVSIDGGEPQVYVTYDGLPISFFAEVAETGTADPADHKLKGNLGNVAANKAYLEKYTERAQGLAAALNAKDSNKTLLGNMLTEITNIANDPASQGDCMQCAINNLDVHDAGLVGAVLGNKIEGILANKGYDYNENGKKFCQAYNPMYAKGGCECDATHGPEAHLSTTSKVQFGAGFEDCPEGGFHTFNVEHVCTKCGTQIDKKHVSDNSVPYIGTLIDDGCMYCGYCKCCAEADELQHQKWKRKYGLFGDWVKDGAPYDVPGGYVNVTVSFVDYDTGICLSGSAVTGSGQAKGCGHTYADHLAQGEKYTCSHEPG